MNDTVFVSQRAYTKESVLEGLKRTPATLSGKFYRWTLRICAVCFLLCAVYILGYFLLAPDMSQFFTWLVSFAISLVAGLLLLFMERLTMLRQYKAMLSMQVTRDLTYTITFSDKITISLGQQNTAFAYSQFGKLTEDSEAFYLWLEKGLTYRVPKDSLVQGEAQDFAAFIQPRLGTLRGGSFGRSRTMLAALLLLLTAIFVHGLFPIFS